MPVKVKQDCCGRSEEHRLKPEQIDRGPNHEYIVCFEGYTFVIAADKALPSHDSCSHIFFPNAWVTDADGNQARRSKAAESPLFPHAARLLTTHGLRREAQLINAGLPSSPEAQRVKLSRHHSPRAICAPTASK